MFWCWLGISWRKHSSFPNGACSAKQLCWETRDIKSQANGTVMPLPCFQHLNCALCIFFSPGPCPLSACVSSLSKHLWKHFLSIVTMLIIPKFYSLHWTSLSPNWSPVLSFIVLHCGFFFLSISSWTAHRKNLPKAEHILPLLHVLIMNILSYRTRKLRKIINFVSSAKGKWKFYNIYIDKKFEGELCSVLTDSIKKAIIIDVWYVDKKKNVLKLWKKSNVIKIHMLRIHT